MNYIRLEAITVHSYCNGIDQWFSTFFEPGPTFVFKKIAGPAELLHVNEADLFLLRNNIADYMT